MLTYRYRELAALGIPYTRTHIKTLMDRRSFPFPKAIKLMNGNVVWDASEVNAWLAKRLAV